MLQRYVFGKYPRNYAINLFSKVLHCVSDLQELCTIQKQRQMTAQSKMLMEKQGRQWNEKNLWEKYEFYQWYFTNLVTAIKTLQELKKNHWNTLLLKKDYNYPFVMLCKYLYSNNIFWFFSVWFHYSTKIVWLFSANGKFSSSMTHSSSISIGRRNWKLV